MPRIDWRHFTHCQLPARISSDACEGRLPISVLGATDDSPTGGPIGFSQIAADGPSLGSDPIGQTPSGQSAGLHCCGHLPEQLQESSLSPSRNEHPQLRVSRVEAIIASMNFFTWHLIRVV